MKPINAQERRNQFLIFLLFFLITVSLTVAIVYYFNFENARKYSIERYKNEKDSYKTDLNSYKDFMTYLSSLNKKISDISAIKDPVEKQQSVKDLTFEKKAGLPDSSLENFSAFYKSVFIDLSKTQSESDWKLKYLTSNDELQKKVDEFIHLKLEYDAYKSMHP